MKYDRNTEAGEREFATAVRSAKLMLELNGDKAFTLATSDERVVWLGIAAFELGWEPARIAAGFTAYVGRP